MGNKHHFFILDDKVIWATGLTFAEKERSDPDPAAYIVSIVERHKVPRDLDAERRAAEKSGKGPPSMGAFKSKGGKSAEGKAKVEKSAPEKGQQEKSAPDKTGEAKPAPAKDGVERLKDKKQ